MKYFIYKSSQFAPYLNKYIFLDEYSNLDNYISNIFNVFNLTINWIKIYIFLKYSIKMNRNRIFTFIIFNIPINYNNFIIDELQHLLVEYCLILVFLTDVRKYL